MASGTKASVNRHRERLWFSPHCIGEATPGLFEHATTAAACGADAAEP